MNYNYLKDEYLELRTQNKGNEGYSFAMIAKLRDMAEKDVYPDGRFSDEECNLWSMLRR